MKLTLYNNDLEELLMQNSFPVFYRDPDSTITEYTRRLKTSFGEAVYQELYFEGIRISYGQAELAMDTRLHFDTDYATVEMHFSLNGHSVMQSADRTLQFNISGNEHNILFMPPFKGKLDFSGKHMQVLEINMPPSFFNRFVSGEQETARQFRKQVAAGVPASLYKHNLPVTPQMLAVIREIITCNRSGIFKRIFLESRVIELLLLQLEQQAAHDCSTFCSVKKVDADKIHHARQLIAANLQKPCSLIDLAQQVGTNEFTLKKGFKEIYGTTVFNYLNDIKMGEARKLLVEEGKSVKEVAFLSGYKNPTHFTAAFKKKFGVTPGQFKR